MDGDLPTVRPDNPTIVGRALVVVSVMVVIALIHAFRVGSYLNGTLFTLYYSYFSDVVIPFGMYFLLCANDVSFRFLRDWRTKALLVVTLTSLTEVMQAFGVHLLGETFDPLDFVMFGAGTLLAVFVDRVVFGRIFTFWSLETKNTSEVTDG